MKKSEFLDELRLEVGLAYDYAKNKEDFIQKVLQTIYQVVRREVPCSLSVYEPLMDGSFRLRYIKGTEALKKDEQFGFGFITLSNIQSTVLLSGNGKQVILVPICSEDQLAYVFKLNIFDHSYSFTKQDVDFVNEVVRFIEAKQVEFFQKEKDKNDQDT